MRLKSKIIAIVLLLSFLNNSAQAVSPERTDLYIIKQIASLTDLLEAEAKLKNTYTYKTLTFAKAVGNPFLKYSALGPYGVVGTMMYELGQHNAPQILYTFGRYILPSRVHASYEKIIGLSFTGLHTYDIFRNPTKHMLGYGFGILGIWLSNQFSYLSDVDEFYQQELKGFVYFCCREAGWYLSHKLDQDLIYAFLDRLPLSVKGYLYAQTPLNEEENLSSPSSCLLKAQGNKEIETCSSDPLSKTLTKEEVLKQTAAIDDTLYSRIEPFPECQDYLLKTQASKTFNSTMDYIITHFNKAKAEGKKFGLIWGELHPSCSCFFQERELFKLVSTLGIDTLYFESTLYGLIYTKSLVDTHILHNFDSKIYDNPDAQAAFKYALASQVGLKIEPTELPLKSHAWYLEEYKLKLKEFLKSETQPAQGHMDIDNDDNMDNKDFMTLYSDAIKLLERIKLRDCPVFSERDENMATALNRANGSFLSKVGAGHLGGLYKRLTREDFLYVFISCIKDMNPFKSSKTEKHKDEEPSLQELMRKVVFEPRKCLSDYETYLEKDFYFFSRSPKVYKSITEDDIEIKGRT